MGNIQQECTKYIEENSQLILNEFDHETVRFKSILFHGFMMQRVNFAVVSLQ